MKLFDRNSLITIQFCWLPTNSWTKVLFLIPEGKKKDNKQNKKMLLTYKANENLRSILQAAMTPLEYGPTSIKWAICVFPKLKAIFFL